MTLPSHRRWLVIAVALAAAVIGTLAALHYHRAGLTLSHYDARGHLIVARRIIDSITPGWQQIGAVWLPLPHLLNALPVQIDLFYRTGASAVAISIASFAIATGSITWIVLALTESPLAAAGGALIFAINPNVLYLQATPMGEPLLLGLTTLGIAMVVACVTDRMPPRAAACVLALACLTRYEAWPVTVAAIAAACWALWRTRQLKTSWFRLHALALYPALAVCGFMLFSRVVIGEWFVANGFFVPENAALGKPLLAAAQIVWGLRALGSAPILAVAGIGVVLMAIGGLVNRQRAFLLIPLALTAAASLPWLAFTDGHPFRIRYMVPLIAMEAIAAGAAVGFARRGRAVLVLALGVLALYELRPLDPLAPMVVEAQWDSPNAPQRQLVTNCLRGAYDGEKIMASMGSLGHYMQDMSRDGFTLRDFLHEGNGDIWLWALEGPRRYAGWVLMEEKAEGGDMLAVIAREHPHFLDGYSRACEGAGLALYRRDAAGSAPDARPSAGVRDDRPRTGNSPSPGS